MNDLIGRVFDFEKRVFPSNDLYAKLAVDGQSPKALIISCADSRVVPELIMQAEPGDRPVSLRLVLGVYELRSGAFPLDGTPASRVHVRFEQNDLGKVAFAETPLRIDNGNLLLDRYGRSIVFGRVSTSTEAN